MDNLIDQTGGLLSTAERDLVAEPSMAVIVHNFDAIHLIFLDPWAISPCRTQANAMSYNIQTFNSLSFFHEAWIKLEGALHDPVCKVRIRQGIPVVLLVSSANHSATT
jgi:hypothetical protein